MFRAVLLEHIYFAINVAWNSKTDKPKRDTFYARDNKIVMGYEWKY